MRVSSSCRRRLYTPQANIAVDMPRGLLRRRRRRYHARRLRVMRRLDLRLPFTRAAA